MRAVFGHPFSLLWFSPFSTPDHGKAETYQYVVWDLSAGKEAARPKLKWEALSSPTELSYGSLLLPVLNMIYSVSPTLAMDSFPCICFLCCQLSALYVYCCVALSEWSCREKENTLWILFANTVMNLFFSEPLLFLLSFQKPSLFLLCVYSCFPMSVNYAQSQKKQISSLSRVVLGHAERFSLGWWGFKIATPEARNTIQWSEWNWI